MQKLHLSLRHKVQRPERVTPSVAFLILIFLVFPLLALDSRPCYIIYGIENTYVAKPFLCVVSYRRLQELVAWMFIPEKTYLLKLSSKESSLRLTHHTSIWSQLTIAAYYTKNIYTILLRACPLPLQELL